MIPFAVVSSVAVHVPFWADPLASDMGVGVYAVAPGFFQYSVAVVIPPASDAVTVNVTVFGAVGQ